MSAMLSSNVEQLRVALGNTFVEQLTYLPIFKGAPESVLPVLIDVGGAKTIVIAETDSSACAAAEGAPSVVTYGRYFKWQNTEHQNIAPPLSLGEAVRSVTGDETLVLDASLPMSRYDVLAQTGNHLLQGETPLPAIKVHCQRRKLIERAWQKSRDADAEKLFDFTATLRQGDLLNALSKEDIPGFDVLDALMEAEQIGALLITSPHEVELFSGLPAATNEALEISALFVAGSPDIYLLSENKLPGLTQNSNRLTHLDDALQSLHEGRIGAQKDALCAGHWMALEKSGLKLTDASMVLRRWQDVRAGGDLPYYILTANAVLAGIDAARNILKSSSGAVMTERELAAIYHAGAEQFTALHGFSDRTHKYFDLLHSGARTLLPAAAADYPVSSADKTIKFDMGLGVVDANGCVRAVSDIARTICCDPKIQALHDRLRLVLIDELIPQIKPGMTGSEVHAIGIDCLRPLETSFQELGILPDGQSVEGYARDCGHALQRTTISSVYFLPTVKTTMETGMVGCVEYVWPIDDVLIAVEDSFYLTPQGGVPITV